MPDFSNGDFEARELGLHAQGAPNWRVSLTFFGEMMTLPSGGEFRETIRARIRDAERIARDARNGGDEAVARSADQIAAEWRALLKIADGG